MSVAVPVSTPTAEPRDVVGRSRRRLAVGRVGVYGFLCAASVIAAAPFLWMILASFKSGREIRSIPPTFWPREATLDNYRAILDEPDLPLLRFYRNSAFVALANVAARCSPVRCSATCSPSSSSASTSRCSGSCWRR